MLTFAYLFSCLMFFSGIGRFLFLTPFYLPAVEIRNDK